MAVHDRGVEGRRDYQGLEHRAIFVTIRNNDDSEGDEKRDKDGDEELCDMAGRCRAW